MKIVATNVVASRPPERQGSPATTIARANILTIILAYELSEFCLDNLRGGIKIENREQCPNRGGEGEKKTRNVPISIWEF